MINRIKHDLTAARINKKDQILIDLLTTLYSEASMVGFNDGKRLPTDTETRKVINKFIKGINDCLKFESKSIKLIKEKSILESYISSDLIVDPSILSREQLTRTIKTYVTAVGQPNKSEIMRYLKSQFNGKYNGKEASTIVDEILL